MLRISQNCTKSSNHGRKSYDENAGFEGRAVPDVVWSGPTFNPRALEEKLFIRNFLIKKNINDLIS